MGFFTDLFNWFDDGDEKEKHYMPYSVNMLQSPEEDEEERSSMRFFNGYDNDELM